MSETSQRRADYTVKGARLGNPLVTGTDSGAEKKKQEEQDWADWEKETGQKRGLGSGAAFSAWKTNRAKMKPVPKPTPTPGLSSLAK